MGVTRHGSADDQRLAAATASPIRWSPPWDGVSAKLRHALIQFRQIRELVENFTHHPTVQLERVDALERGQGWVGIDLIIEHPGEDLALLIGDFLHNLRCAMDHTLAVLNPECARSLGFPACSSEQSFDKWASRWVKAGGQSVVVDVLRRHQSFTLLDEFDSESLSRLDPDNYALRIVARLNNADKHELLHTTPVSLSSRRPPNMEVVADAPIEEIDWVLRPGPLRRRQPALFVRFDGPAAGYGVGIEGTIPIGVALERYDEAVSLCRDLHEGVVDVCTEVRAARLGHSAA